MADNLNPEEAKKLVKVLQEIADLNEKIKGSQGQQKKLFEDQLKLAKAIKDGGTDADTLKGLTERIASTKALIAANEELNKSVASSQAIGESFGNSIFELDNIFLKAIGSADGLTNAYNSFAEGVQKAGAQSSLFTIGLDSAFTGVTDLVKGTIAAVSALDGAGASFVQNTGASRDFARAAYETRDSLGLMGISGESAVETMGDLYSGLNEFTELSEDSQQSLIVLAAQIDKLGGDAAGMGQVFTKVAGMSMAQAEESMLEVAGAADALGIPFSQVSNDLIGMGELFAKMGDGALDVFLELQAAAKATGMSVQSLYNIVGQYDTFEASSQAAGRLNMVLGGNLLDTYSLLNATEEERIELLQEAMEQSSLTFDEMDRFQKREVSDALNISMEEASQLFGATSEEVRKTAAELMHAGMTQEELTARTMDAATAMDKFNVLMGNLAILVGPIVEGINWMIDGLLSAADHVGSAGAAFIFVALGIVAAMGKAYVAGKLFGFQMKVAGKAAGTSGKAMAAGIGSVGKAAAANALGILALGAAMLMVGAGIGLAAWGMSTLVAAFGDLEGAQIGGAVVAIIAFSTAVVGLGIALGVFAGPISAALVAIGTGLTVTVPGMLAFGAAALMVGGGIWLAASGMANLVSSFAEMDVEKIAAIGTSMFAFAAGMVSLALAAGLGGGRMVKRVVKFINRLDTEKADSFAAALSSLAQLAEADLGGSGIPKFIQEISAALDGLPDNTDKMLTFKTTADSLSSLMQIGSSVEAEQLERIKMIIDAVSNVEGSEATGRLADAINSLVRGQANNEGTTNVIELDGRVLARWLDKHEATRFRAAIGG